MDGETAEQFIIELYNLVEFCNYGNLTSEMIQDRFVVGIQDYHLSKRLQLDPELTLEKAKRAIHQHEAVHGQQDSLKGGSDPSCNLDRLQASCRGNHPRKGTKKFQHTSAKQCKHCGKEPHNCNKCPAKDVTCSQCHKKGTIVHAAYPNH